MSNERTILWPFRGPRGKPGPGGQDFQKGAFGTSGFAGQDCLGTPHSSAVLLGQVQVRPVPISLKGTRVSIDVLVVLTVQMYRACKL
jgi:hypothetical protein